MMLPVLCVLAFLDALRFASGFNARRLSQGSCAVAGVRHGLFRVRRLYSSLFDEAEVRAMNPPVPPPPPKKPAIYVRNDALSAYRYANFQSVGTDTRHVACLPSAEFRYQDKGALIPFKSVGEIVSTYCNRLSTLLSNFDEWTCAYNPSGEGVGDLSLYNPLSTGSYYAVVFYCAWQSESIALKRAIHQLCGRFSFLRDPPVIHGPKPREKLEDLVAKIEEVDRRHQELIASAREQGLPDPERPPLYERVQATLTMRSFNTDLTTKILDHLHGHYNYRWWMPKVGQLKYNKVLSRALNELYNTSYKVVRSDRSRLKYKLSDRGKRPAPRKSHLGDGHTAAANLTRVNFIMVRLANSLMLSNSKRGLDRMRSLSHSHEKEMHFNEIIMRLLIDSGVLYKDMPVVELFKCVNPQDTIAPVFASKRHEVVPFDMTSPFYQPDPFAIARHTLYGLPPLRKCGHLSVPEDFKHVGTLMGLGDLPTLSSMDDLFPSGSDSLSCDFLRTLKRSSSASSEGAEDVDSLEPFLTTLELMYKMNFKQIVDARPVPVVYGYLNP